MIVLYAFCDVQYVIVFVWKRGKHTLGNVYFIVRFNVNNVMRSLVIQQKLNIQT